MAAFNDWTDLRIAVAENVGNREISDVLDRLCVIAEVELEMSIRHRMMLVDTTLSFIDGSAIVPADYLETERLISPDGRLMMETSFNDNPRWNEVSPYWYEILGLNIKASVGTADLRHVYYRTLPTLTASNTTSNWLLAKFPLAYLYAVSFEAAKWLQDVDRATASSSLLGDQIKTIQIENERAVFGNSKVRFSGAASRI
jgi:hypothetical protein